jgi:branched-subunit amino acid ABC-type transport system permease component
LLGVKGLVAALVVGFVSPARSFAAGLLLGVVESAIASGRLFAHGIGPSYREVLPIGFALLLLAYRARLRPSEVE